MAFVQRVYIYQSTLPVCNPVLWIRIDFNADSDPAFQVKVDPDPVPDPRI